MGRRNGRIVAGVVGALGLLFSNSYLTDAKAALTTNNWIGATSAKWETTADWSLGITPNQLQSGTTITNGFTSGQTSKTNIYDFTSTGLAPAGISNLFLSGSSDGVGGPPNIGTNVLLFANTTSSPGFTVANSLIISNGGLLLITNSFVYVGGLGGSSQFFNDGGLVIETAASRLVTTSATARVGSTGVGNVVISNGLWWASVINVGTSAGSHGILHMPGGSIETSAFGATVALDVGVNAGATGEVWITGGSAQVQAANIIGGGGIGTLTISNGGWNAEATIVGNTGVGTLTIAGGSGSASAVDPAIGLDIGVNAGATGTVWVTGGSLGVDQFTGVSNAFTLGDSGAGIMTVSNGTVTLGGVSSEPGNSFIGNSLGGNGTLTVAGGTVTFVANVLDIGHATGATGTVWVTGGRMLLTNNTLNTVTVGRLGVGQMTVSNGFWASRFVRVGLLNTGTLTIAGGTNTLLSSLVIGASATGTVWVTGGLLSSTNNSAINSVGAVIGQMTVSNGIVRIANLGVGPFSGSSGSMTLAGGSSSVYSNLTIGAADCTGAGTVTVNGGNLFVTNATATAVLDVESGTFILNSGTVIVDKFVMTNSCAHFVRTGGTLIYGTAILNAARDDDGDGIPNGYEQSHGLDPLDSINTTKDSDGDGMTDLQEYLAGTDPINAASFLGITAIATEGTNLRVTWMMGSGKTNALQVTPGTSDGSYTTNSFANLFIVTNTIGTTTNYLDVGGATNTPARFYRIRLVP